LLIALGLTVLSLTGCATADALNGGGLAGQPQVSVSVNGKSTTTRPAASKPAAAQPRAQAPATSGKLGSAFTPEQLAAMEAASATAQAEVDAQAQAAPAEAASAEAVVPAPDAEQVHQALEQSGQLPVPTESPVLAEEMKPIFHPVEGADFWVVENYMYNGQKVGAVVCLDPENFIVDTSRSGAMPDQEAKDLAAMNKNGLLTSPVPIPADVRAMLGI
jgi:hypothetical protein